MTRGAVAAALAATVALGASAPAAVAGPKADHAKATHKTVKADKAKATKAERALLKQATRKQAYLTRLLDSKKLERLEQTAEDAVTANILADIAELAALTTPTAADETTTAPAGVRSYRPEVYHTIINQLRLATRLQAAAGELTEGTDPAAVPAVTALGTLVGELKTYDADTTRAELRAAQRVLSSAMAAIEDAEESETETEAGTETGTETDTDTDTTAGAS
jgi:hypothetical protein